MAMTVPRIRLRRTLNVAARVDQRRSPPLPRRSSLPPDPTRRGPTFPRGPRMIRHLSVRRHRLFLHVPRPSNVPLGTQ